MLNPIRLFFCLVFDNKWRLLDDILKNLNALVLPSTGRYNNKHKPKADEFCRSQLKTTSQRHLAKGTVIQ